MCFNLLLHVLSLGLKSASPVPGAARGGSKIRGVYWGWESDLERKFTCGRAMSMTKGFSSGRVLQTTTYDEPKRSLHYILAVKLYLKLWIRFHVILIMVAFSQLTRNTKGSFLVWWPNHSYESDLINEPVNKLAWNWLGRIQCLFWTFFKLN